MMLYADLIVTNARVYSMEVEGEHAESFAIKDGRILAIGAYNKIDLLKGPDTAIYDADSKAVLPAFIESHAHPLDFAKKQLELDLRPRMTPNREAVMQVIKEEVTKKQKGEWIIGAGWDENLMEGKQFVTMADLDAIAPEHPVFLLRTCVHNAMVNTKAFEASMIALDASDPEGGSFERDESGSLTGYVMEDAMSVFKTPTYSIEETKQAWKIAEEIFLSWGIATINDMATGKEEFKVYQQLQKENRLRLNVGMWLWGRTQMSRTGLQEGITTLGIESGFGNEQLNVQGIKFMIDGSVGGKTAAVAEPFEGTADNYGILYLKQSELNERFKKSVQNNLRISVHAIGERAIEMALQAFEYAEVEKYPHIARHRIEHAILPTEDHLKRMQKLGIIAGSSIGFLYSIGDGYVNNLGQERVKRAFPHQTFKAYGIVAPGNSDLPVTEGNPFLGVYTAVTRTTSSGTKTDRTESLSVYDALRAYMIDAAYGNFDEHKRGTLTVGKKADFMVVSSDPFTVQEEQLKDIQVLATYVEGVERYRVGEEVRV